MTIYIILFLSLPNFYFTFLVNFYCKLWRIMTRYEFLEAWRMASAMLEPTPILYHFNFSNFFSWIGTSYDLLIRGQMSDFRNIRISSLNQLQLDLIINTFK